MVCGQLDTLIIFPTSKFQIHCYEDGYTMTLDTIVYKGSLYNQNLKPASITYYLQIELDSLFKVMHSIVY